MRVDALHVEVPPPAAPAATKLTTRHIPLLRRYIPAAVQPKLHAGHSGHLAELRHVSVLFARFSGLDLAAAANGSCAEAIDAGHHLMLYVQRAVYTWEGSINKFMVDDKGLVVLCVFGLPPMAHADDAKRAAAAAKMLADGTEDLGPDVLCSIGVTSGFVFCGVVGAPERREYTVMGRVVNLAARLMASAGPSQVLVDATTMEKSSAYLDFNVVDVGVLKGVRSAVVAYSPTAVKQAPAAKKSVLQLEARRSEVEQLTSIVGDAARFGTVIVLTGERGSGKSVVVDQLPAIGKGAGFLVLKGHSKTPARGSDDAVKVTKQPNADTGGGKGIGKANATGNGGEHGNGSGAAEDNAEATAEANADAAPGSPTPSSATTGATSPGTVTDADDGSSRQTLSPTALSSPSLSASSSAVRLAVPEASSGQRRRNRKKEPPLSASAGAALHGLQRQETFNNTNEPKNHASNSAAAASANGAAFGAGAATNATSTESTTATPTTSASAGQGNASKQLKRTMSDPPPFTLRRSPSLRKRATSNISVDASPLPLEEVEVDLGAWRGVFEQLLEYKQQASGKDARACVIETLLDEDLLHAPLLNLFMPELQIAEADTAAVSAARQAAARAREAAAAALQESDDSSTSQTSMSNAADVSNAAAEAGRMAQADVSDGNGDVQATPGSPSLSSNVAERRRTMINSVPLARLQPGICIQRLKQILLNMLASAARKMQLMIVLHLQTGAC